MTPIFEAIQSGDPSRVGALLDADPSLANARNDQGTSALAYSAYVRKPEITVLLETRGAEVDIFAAAMLGRSETIAQQLAGNKSLATLLSRDGWTALHLAAFFGHVDAARELLNKGAVINARSTNAMKNMPLHAAAAGRSLPVVTLLIERGADTNAQQHGGWTPLHSASANGDLEMVRALVEGGADTAARADNQQLPLDLALTKGHQAVVDFLESRGASLG
jgi:ankyrin repeat protein